MGANVIDLTSVAAVNNWLNQGSGVDAGIIQSAVTAFSQFVLTLTGRNNLSQIKFLLRDPETEPALRPSTSAIIRS